MTQVAQDADIIPFPPFPPFPATEPERYVTRPELAAMMGVSVRTIDSLIKEGLPHVRWGRRMVRFNPAEAIGWARDHRKAS